MAVCLINSAGANMSLYKTFTVGPKVRFISCNKSAIKRSSELEETVISLTHAHESLLGFHMHNFIMSLLTF